jgi:hypothetical protein
MFLNRRILLTLFLFCPFLWLLRSRQAGNSTETEYLPGRNKTGNRPKRESLQNCDARKIRICAGRVYFIYRDINQQSRGFLFAAQLEDL